MRAFVIVTLLKLLSHLSLAKLHRLGEYIGRLLYAVPNQAREITQVNIDYCFPELPPHEQQTLVRQALIETGKTFAENAALWFWPRPRLEQLIEETASCDLFKQILSENKGAIIIAPHLGSWEIVGLYASQFAPLTAMYRPPRIAKLESIIRQGRERMGMQLAPTNQQGIRSLSRALKQNECIGILPDQDPGDNGGIFAAFFDRPANTMTLVSRLANKTKAPCIFIYAERLELGKGYRIHCVSAPTALSEGNIEDSVLAMNQTVETCVLNAQTQYQWAYKRFKNPPGGGANVYSLYKRRKKS